MKAPLKRPFFNFTPRLGTYTSATCGVGVRFIRELEHGKKTCQIGKAIHVLQMTGLDVYTAKRNFVQGNQTVTER